MRAAHRSPRTSCSKALDHDLATAGYPIAHSGRLFPQGVEIEQEEAARWIPNIFLSSKRVHQTLQWERSWSTFPIPRDGLGSALSRSGTGSFLVRVRSALKRTESCSAPAGLGPFGLRPRPKSRSPSPTS